MGRFDEYVTDGKRWYRGDARLPEPWLKVSVHDSSIGALEYSPTLGGSGTAFIGYTPRAYFEDDSAPVTDAARRGRDVSGLVAWFAGVGIVEDWLPGELDRLVVDDDSDEPEEAFVEAELERFFSRTPMGWPDDDF